MTQRNAKLTLAALALVCTLPVAASYLAYYVWQPTGKVNYGELIGPAPLPEAQLAGIAGQPAVRRAELNGRWMLLYVGPGDCDAACEHALYASRQSRLAQGEDMTRVGRLWVVTDDAVPSPRVLADHDGLRVARGDPAWAAALPAANEGGGLILVDPLGNAMMRFPPLADIKLVIKDLQRLLKYSPLGRGES
ncbi:SCO family protein [Aromatoleum sp.]|uniref:SCO family protein n=1 Tax=Aromatoleum sp. TaxID=2307007 RepID=UPI002FC6A425